MFGNGPHLPGDLLYGRPESNEKYNDTSSDADKVRDRLETVHRYA